MKQQKWKTEIVINELDKITSYKSDCLHDLKALGNIFELNKGY